MANNGEALISAARFALSLMPPEARLALARRMIAYCTEVERDALASLGGVEPSEGETVEAEGRER